MGMSFVCPHAVRCAGRRCPGGGQVLHHAALAAPLRVSSSGTRLEDHLVMLSPPLQQVALGVPEGFIVLLEDDLAPGQGDIPNGHLPGGHACPLQVALGDGVGLVDVDGVVVVGLKADGGEWRAICWRSSHPVGQKGLVSHFPVRKSYRAEPLDRITGALMGMWLAWGGESWGGAAGGLVKVPPSRVKWVRASTFSQVMRMSSPVERCRQNR